MKPHKTTIWYSDKTEKQMEELRERLPGGFQLGKFVEKLVAHYHKKVKAYKPPDDL